MIPDSVAVVPLGLLLLSLVVMSARWPYRALRALLVLLPLHSGAVLLLSNVLHVDGAPLTLASAWKEAVIVGLVIAALFVVRDGRCSWRASHWLALGLLALIATRAALEIAADSGSAVAILFGARQLGEFLIAFLAVAILRPSPRWFLGTAKWLLPVMVVVGVLAIVQPNLGAGFYDQFFHGPGERLHHAYLVNIADARRFRAVGTFIAPNELGLGLIVYGMIFIVPLLAAIAKWRWVAVVAMLLIIALLLSFSRSAWVGLAVGVAVAALVVRRDVIRLYRAGVLFQTPLREILIGSLSAAGLALAVFVLAGGVGLFLGTVSGSESSAAGRGASIAGGIEATFDNPGGLGLGTAGPRALELTGSSVLTENWYLLYSIQLGLVALALVAALAAAAAIESSRAVRRGFAALVPPFSDYFMQRYRAAVILGTFVALIAALVGALVIPALLDLPASIALWTAVAVILGWTDAGGLDSQHMPSVATREGR